MAGIQELTATASETMMGATESPVGRMAAAGAGDALIMGQEGPSFEPLTGVQQQVFSFGASQDAATAGAPKARLKTDAMAQNRIMAESV